MKKILIVICVFIISACSSDSNNTQSSLISGTWSYIVPATQCSESYTFNSDNTVRITALDEIIDGTYTFSSQTNSSNRHALSITTISDNQLPDCEGSNDDDSNLVLDIFVEFKTQTEMDWYVQSAGGDVLITLNKN